MCWPPSHFHPRLLVRVSFELPDGGAGIEGDAEVAWSTRQRSNRPALSRHGRQDARRAERVAGARSHDALPEEPDAVTQCKLTDLSLGGCYVETESPFPQSSAVDLCLRAAGMEIHAEGLVRVMHPGHGMGIEFPARTEEQRKSVGEFIEFLTGQPGATPQLETSPRSLVANVVDLEPRPAAPQPTRTILCWNCCGPAMGWRKKRFSTNCTASEIRRASINRSPPIDVRPLVF